MKTLLLTSGLALTIAAAASPAQSPRLGITGGIVMGAQNDGYLIAAAPDVGGWSAGVTYGALSSYKVFNIRLDAGYSALNNGLIFVNNPGGCGCSYSLNYQSLGAAATFTLDPLGAHARVSPYLLAGAGWYAVRSSSPNAGAVATTQSSTVGVIGYNLGLGVRISRMFVEARASMLDGVSTLQGSRERLWSYPVTIGYWF
jgi:hypothetical protein